MPIPQDQINDRKKVRCPFCDNVLGTGKFVSGFQMLCLNKYNTACGRLLEINLTENGMQVVEVPSKARDPTIIQMPQ